MNEVPLPITAPIIREDDGPAHPVRFVSALGAELDTFSQTVVLRLRDPENDKDFVFALSPPAATQLSRRLEEAVKSYLQGDHVQ